MNYPLQISSPDQSLTVHFSLSEDGQAQYTTTYEGEKIIDTSTLGFEFKNQPPFKTGLKVGDQKTESVDKTWDPVWGERKEIRNHYNELLIKLAEQNEPNRLIYLQFRIYNDGFGFRFEFPDRENWPNSLTIMDEQTQFTLTGDHQTWWIPADYDSYEYNYRQTRVSEIDSSEFEHQNKRADRQIDNFRAVNTPVTMKTNSGIYLCFHEAALVDYAGMTLAVSDDLKLVSELVPWADGTKVKAQIPFTTPWRIVQVGNKPGELAESSLLLNLNEPNKLDDTSWIEPLKYTGIWWELQVGKTTWGIEESVEESYGNKGGTRHGATTENAKEYIDFNARAGIRGLLIEGWNTGWEYWGTDVLDFFDFTTSYPDFDLEEVTQYAEEKGVAIMGHHETSGQAALYESRLNAAFKLYQKVGIHHVKTGYAGGIIPKGEFHHGQYMVRHHQKVVETAAKYKIAVNIHEPIKGTGLCRTYPNLMTREGVRGMEYNAWSEGSPPEHTTILPFTRCLSGPVDYTPGIFNITLEGYRDEEQVHSTLANQLALYVVLYSPLQMVADMPENYLLDDRTFHPMFQFIREVPVEWDDTNILDARIGDYVVTARREKESDDWFLGAVTDEQERTIEIALSFLSDNKIYRATTYRDSENAHWKENPTAYIIDEQKVCDKDVLNIRMAPGGGTAIHFEML